MTKGNDITHRKIKKINLQSLLKEPNKSKKYFSLRMIINHQENVGTKIENVGNDSAENTCSTDLNIFMKISGRRKSKVEF